MASKRNVTWKCPFCDKRFNREKLVIHVDDKHQEEIPEGFTALRYVFHYVNKRPLDYHGRCTECKGPTPWDEEVGRYKRQCGKKECHDSYVKRFEENMVKKKGYTRETSTQEGLERMLKNRKISGYYTFQNGKKLGYVGSYEKKCLEFMDKVMNIDPDDIMAPGPTMEYKFEGKNHYYITDFYYQPYNLIIEVKDGGDNPNTRNMEEYRKKQIAKEEYIIKHTDYNYIRLTNNDFAQLMSVFADLKMQLVDNSKDRVIHVNESTNILNEKYLFNTEDILYNKDKFDSGEINLCFIIGLSGSGKSTLGRNMSSDKVEHYEMDDLLNVADHFTMDNLKEYGDLIYSFFNGPGKKYYVGWDYLVQNNIPGSEYEDKLFVDFVNYAKKYAASHKSTKFVVEGVWIFEKSETGGYLFKPEDFKDYAFYIKGTSAIISSIRAMKRDSQDAGDKSAQRKAFLKHITKFKDWKIRLSAEKDLERFRKYFINLMKKESVKEEAVFNEFMNALTSGYFPGYEDCDAYICTADYMMNNVFANCGENFFAIANDPAMSKLTYVNNEGVLTSSTLEEFNKTYPGVADNMNIFALKVPMSGIYNALANYIGEELDREGMYYSVFKEHLYSIDQVRFSDKVLGEVNNEIADFNAFYNMTKGTLIYNESDMIPKGDNKYYNFRNGKTYIKSEINPNFFIESTSKKDKVFMEQILLGGIVNNG